MKRWYAMVVLVSLFIFGCVQQQQPGSTTPVKEQAQKVIGKEAQAQEQEDELKDSLMQGEQSIQEPMTEEAKEAILSVSAGVPAIEESAEILGVVSDEPLDESLLEGLTAKEGVQEEISQEIKEELTEEANQEDAVIEPDEAVQEEAKTAIEAAISENLINEAVEREVAKIVGDDTAQKAVSYAMSTDEGDAVAAHAWGFSVYDPESETVEYYSSDGQFLGKK